MIHSYTPLLKLTVYEGTAINLAISDVFGCPLILLVRRSSSGSYYICNIDRQTERDLPRMATVLDAMLAAMDHARGSYTTVSAG